MIELLVVISVIVVLAGILIPSVGMINRQAKWTHSANNLRQIGIGILAHRAEHRDEPPAYLSSMFEHGGSLAGAPRKILVDPLDSSPLAENTTNRIVGQVWPPDAKNKWGDFEFIIKAETIKPVSFFYETSAWLGVDEAHSSFSSWVNDWPKDARDRFTANEADTWTWADYKHYQQQFGNRRGDPIAPQSTQWSPSVMPMVRSYWHHNWHPLEEHWKIFKVLNVNMDGTVSESSPYWEVDQNPEHFDP